jgi:ribonuclease Z
MNFSLRILGVNSATPAHGRYPSSQVLHVQNHFFLIDCGEGTQMRLRDFHVPFFRINQIFISHLHGDHVFGLPGLILSYALMGRRVALEIFSPPGLETMILAQLKPTGADLPFPLQFYEIDTRKSHLIFENEAVSVTGIPLNHRIPTTGFLFQERQRPLNIIPEKIEVLNLDIEQIKAIKSGEDIKLPGGTVVPNSELTITAQPLRSFAYISDTIYDDDIVPLISGVNTLYHETTFLDELSEYATLTKHSTARQAGRIARLAGVKKLITGHYSTRYKDLTPLLDEARSEFPETELGIEGNIYEV